MERETTQLTIGEHTYTVKSFATARESHAIQQAYFRGAKVEVAGDQPRISEFNPGVQFEVHQEMIRQLVVEMDGSADTIIERCIDVLPNDEFDELVRQLDELVSKKKS